MGDGTRTNRGTDGEAMLLEFPVNVEPRDLFGGFYHNCIMDQNHKVFCWGEK
jgi:hypothetical protein